MSVRKSEKAAAEGVHLPEVIQDLKSAEPRPVLITTLHRGVFFGYTTEDTQTLLTRGSGVFTKVRNCFYWSADVRGFVGLASSGPTVNCKIGPAADGGVKDITSVLTVTPEAAQKWEAAPWRG